MSAITVKPLVWTVRLEPTFRLTYHTAEVGLGRYYQIVEPPPGMANGFALWTEAKDMSDPPSGTVNGTGYTTLEAAKAAAQAEWEAFVLAAITPFVPPETARERPATSEDDARIIAEWRERHAADTWRARLRKITNCGNEEVQVCTCSRTDVCPLGRSPSEKRCTEDELEAHGRQKGWRV